jgi:hypothetical protein
MGSKNRDSQYTYVAYVDGSYGPEEDNCGIGGVILCPESSRKIAFSCRLPTPQTSTSCETSAVCFALAVLPKGSRILIRNDCQGLVEKIKTACLDDWINTQRNVAHWLAASELRQSLLNHENVHAEYCSDSHELSSFAHELAKNGARSRSGDLIETFTAISCQSPKNEKSPKTFQSLRRTNFFETISDIIVNSSKKRPNLLFSLDI